MSTAVASAAFVLSTSVLAGGPPATDEVPVTTSSKPALEQFEKGRTMTENYQAPQSVAVFKKAIELDPSFAQAHAYLGWVSPNPEGMAACEKAVSLAAKLPEAERTLIDLIHANKRGDNPKVIELEKKLATLAPKDWRVHLMLGGRAQGEGRYADAEAAYKKSFTLNPKNGWTQGALGYLYLEQKKVDAAIKAFEQYQALSPTQANAPDSLADAYLAANRLADAEATYLKAIKLDAGFFLTWSGVAVARALQGNFAGAEEAMLHQRKGAPAPADEYGAAVFGAWLKFAAGKDGDAAKALEEVQKFTAEKKLAMPAAFVLFEQGELLNYQGKPKEALAKAKEGLALAEKNRAAGDKLVGARAYGFAVQARAQADLGLKDDAKKTAADYDVLAKEFKGDLRMEARRHYFAGEALWAAGDAKGAAAEMAQCYEDDSFCLWRAVQAAEKAGDKATAKAITDRVVKIPRRDSTYIFMRAKLGTIPAMAAAKK